MSTKIWTLILNIAIIAASTYTAVTFNKWWIVLIGFLFLYSYKEEAKVKRYYRICDMCGKQSPSALNPEKALDEAIAAGWHHVEEYDKDFCPECCRKKFK